MKQNPDDKKGLPSALLPLTGLDIPWWVGGPRINARPRQFYGRKEKHQPPANER